MLYPISCPVFTFVVLDGKSTLLNKLVGFNRSIVSNKPKTTTDIVNSSFEFKGINYSIKDTAGYNATLTLATPGDQYSLGFNKDIVIDGIVPTVTNVTSDNSNGTYKIGDTIDIKVLFSETVTITSGTPTLSLSTGSPSTTAVNYISGTNSNTLVFQYTVVSGNFSAELTYSSTPALAGNITDTAGKSANLTLVASGNRG